MVRYNRGHHRRLHDLARFRAARDGVGVRTVRLRQRRLDRLWADGRGRGALDAEYRAVRLQPARHLPLPHPQAAGGGGGVSAIVSKIDDGSDTYRTYAAHSRALAGALRDKVAQSALGGAEKHRSEEHTSELQSLMRISYAVFCLKKKKT